MPKTKPVSPVPPPPSPSPSSSPSPSLTRAELSAADKVLRKMTGSHLPGKTKVELLPQVCDVFLSDAEAQAAVDLLERAHNVKEQVDGLNAELGGLKEIATASCIGAGVDGFRWGTLAVTASLMPGRSTLNKDLLRANLIDAGVDPTEVSRIIDASHATGEPFYIVKFERLGK